MQRKLKTLACTGLIAATLWSFGAAARAQEAEQTPPPAPPVIEPGPQLDQVFSEALNVIKTAQASQGRIDKIASETDRLFREYSTKLKEIESLQAYNAQQERVIRDQKAKMAEIQKSIDGVVAVRRGITPLMLEMLEALEKFVDLDVPFKLEDRKARLARLKDYMDDSDISAPEKFRLVLEAYQTEVEYGRTIEAYEGTVKIDGNDRVVNFLRIGRVVLAYQTPDGEEQGFWNPNTRQWEPLPARYSTQIRDALRYAQKQAAPNLYILPVTGPEQAK